MDPERAIYATKGRYGGQIITCDRAAALQMIDGGYAVPLEDTGLGRTGMGGRTADAYEDVDFTTLNGRPYVAPEPPEPPDDPDPAENPWDGFTTHAQIAEWVAHFQSQHGLVLPDGWDRMTVAAKKAWLGANVDPTP